MGKKKILWVEDDALLGAILTKEMAASEFDLIQAKDGEEAVELLKGIIPDMAIIDLVLPGTVDGFGVLKEMQADPRMKGVPRVVLSNLSKPSDIERATKLGADTFMVKAESSLDRIMGEIRKRTNK